MGEANNRGDHAERLEQAIERHLDEAEVLIMLKADDGKLEVSMLPRDEDPNQDSPAVIFAAFINANFKELAGQAMALYMSHAAAERGELPMEGSGQIVEAPKRSVVDQAGQIAGAGPVLLGPDGERLN